MDRFGPDYIKKIDDTLKKVAALHYDVEEFRISLDQYTKKNVTDALDRKVDKMTPLKNFNDLAVKSDSFAQNDTVKDIQDTLKELEKQL